MVNRSVPSPTLWFWEMKNTEIGRSKNDLFAPAIAKHSIRSLVAYGISLGRRTKQCDAKNAFLLRNP